MSGTLMVSTQRRAKLARARLRFLLGAALWLPWACTLTQEDFEPNDVSRLDSAPAAPDAGAGATPSESCPGGARCCSSDAECAAGELCTDGSCAVSCSVAEDPSACELALCPGPRCPSAAASCEDGAQNGREPAPDCGASCPLPCPAASACNIDRDCLSLRCVGGLCAEASCDDGVENQGEADVDCGGPCPSPCASGGACGGDADCAEGLSCAPATGRCTAASCQDGMQSGAETLVDCGGGECPGCPAGSPCGAGDDCDSGVCSQEGECAAAACPDGVSNGAESGLDCGGASPSCPRCPDGQPCASGADCASGSCDGARCVSCVDGERNGTETDTDCGGESCPPCGGGERCSVGEDCADGDCRGGACVEARCDDGAQNGTESDTDCGGADPSCARCGSGSSCSVGADCASQRCVAERCVACDDGARNGTESDTDCGGADPSCARCGSGSSCLVDTDCASGACEGGTCCGGALGDCTRCALRLSPSVDCDAPAAGVDSAGVVNCTAFLACLADNAERCPTRNAPGCSGDDQASDACPHNDYGGNAGTGVTRANLVLVNAGCQL